MLFDLGGASPPAESHVEPKASDDWHNRHRGKRFRMLELKSAVSPETALTEASEVSGKTAEKIRFSSDFRLAFRERHNWQKVAFSFGLDLLFPKADYPNFFRYISKSRLLFRQATLR